MNLTAGIKLIFRGLTFMGNDELREKAIYGQIMTWLFKAAI